MERMGFLRIVPRKGTFVAEYVRRATPETLSAIMSYDSALIDSTLFRDLMDLRILVERECTRLACARLTPESLRLLQAHADAIYVFQSFEKMIRNLIREHYKNASELTRSLPKFTLLTEAVARRDAFEADRCILSVLEQASDYLNTHLKSREAGRGE